MALGDSWVGRCPSSCSPASPPMELAAWWDLPEGLTLSHCPQSRLIGLYGMFWSTVCFFCAKPELPAAVLYIYNVFLVIVTRKEQGFPN